MDIVHIELWLHAILIVDGHKDLLTAHKMMYDEIRKCFEKLGCEVEEIGGTKNHVHILFAMSPDISIDELLKRTRLATQTVYQKRRNADFFWENDYLVYSTDTPSLESERNKIIQQPTIHQNITLAEELNKLIKDLKMNETNELTDVNENSFN